ncbi:tetratricopeptide repeat protein [Photobacterium sp. 1_MG-2023]|uniref:tetratricopeptide repeat protein n=1 Tax=Photobacterium sp. 1_MG-2023 TaxID=3062646 RepID=UPI0026E3E89B|nr:tetratricopeptide repeat protein [Photobacterium sp. 1_MG-2023]MDO6707360.1 tetratricopeptide repeat protein [Photobacterium sp. 1_MG-2023]
MTSSGKLLAPALNGLINLKQIAFGTLFGIALVGVSLQPVQASVTTKPTNHLKSTLKYVELEAEEGDKNMQLFLGRAYLEGNRGIAADPMKGLYWLEKASVDMPEVKTMIGDLFKNGQLLPQNNELAVHWYTKAAKAGDLPAMEELGVYYASGANGKVNCGKAIHWFTQASNGGSLNSKRNLVWLYATCENDQERDGYLALKLAKEVIHKAQADAGDYDNLAAAYAACGQFPQAVRAQEIALEKLEQSAESHRIAKFTERLRLYQQNQTIYSASL